LTRTRIQNPISVHRPVVRRAVACLGLLLLISISISTARAQYRFDHWTAETGLPQNIITAIHQTPEGYLWVATFYRWVEA